MQRALLLSALATVAGGAVNVCMDPRNPGHHCVDYQNQAQKHLESEMWWFDHADGKCQRLVYLGCGGNYNRFRLRQDCESHCFKTAPSNWQDPRPLPAERRDSGAKSEKREESVGVEEELRRPEFRNYDKCMEYLEPSAQRDFAAGNHRAEFDDIIALRGRSKVEAAWEGRLVAPELWTGAVVPYEVSDDASRDEREKIACAILYFHENSCVRFRPRKMSDKDYVHMTTQYFGCYSDAIGKSGGRHVVNLDRHHTHCWLHGTIIHELMHALGFFHEQSRDDRDEFISINWSNVASYNFDEFQRARQRGFDYKPEGEYDYKSVMHYPRTTDGKTVMTAVKAPIAANNAAMGNRRAPTDMDTAKINALYQCKDELKEVKKTIAADQEILKQMEDGEKKATEQDAPPKKNIDVVYDKCVSEENGYWNVKTGSCFWWNSTYLSWYDAMTNCSAMAPENSLGRLAWITEDQTFSNLRPVLPSYHFWIGLRAIIRQATNLTNGEWGYYNSSSIWSTRPVFDPRPLGVSVFLAHDKGDCLLYAQNYWQDDFCYNSQAFLCEFVPDVEKKAEEDPKKKSEEKDSKENNDKDDVSEDDVDEEDEDSYDEYDGEDDEVTKELDLEEEIGVRVVGRKRRQDIKGRAEVFAFGEWGTVCGDAWDDDDATVFCAQLNYPKGEALVRGSGYSVGRSGQIWLDDVKCTGEELDILDCRHNPLGVHNCAHSEDAGVHCFH